MVNQIARALLNMPKRGWKKSIELITEIEQTEMEIEMIPLNQIVYTFIYSS